MSEPINFMKLFICDYIEDVEEAVNEYVKEHRVKPVSASITCPDGVVVAAVVFERRFFSV